MRIKVNSEIAGQVWKVTAAQGTSMDADEPIIILESMKMEIPIVAPKAGVLIELHVGEEDMVAEGQLIAIIESA
ncbi:acetyl-CoA carboxylase biotin carboxyl carrier protein subunit [Alphaproteobacteria bacterium]|nr:acetyl-CoA carboxylase biotin carboxyl carrier protein subunit [Alphaproteobacteria bacterium]